MSLAATTREAVRERPFLLTALRTGVLNYAAAADYLDLDGDPEAVAAALRRFEADLPDYDADRRDARVTLTRGVGVRAADGDDRGGADEGGDERHTGDAASDDPLVVVGGAAVVADAGSETAVLATGDVDAAALAAVLDRLLAAGIDPSAASVAGDALAVAVGGRDGVTALRVVEDALAAVPTAATEAE